MTRQHPISELRVIPVDAIEVLNPRDRNTQRFEDIVRNIQTIGLKKPITVTPRPGRDGEEHYLLICGEGRLKAFKMLGEKDIPAMVVQASDEDAFVMSLAKTSLAENAVLWSCSQALADYRSRGMTRKPSPRRLV